MLFIFTFLILIFLLINYLGLKNFFLGFEDITNHHTDLSDSDPKIVKCLDIFVHESQTYQDYQEKKISFHELIEILKGNLNNHE